MNTRRHPLCFGMRWKGRLRAQLACASAPSGCGERVVCRFRQFLDVLGSVDAPRSPPAKLYNRVVTIDGEDQYPCARTPTRPANQWPAAMEG